MPPWLFFFQSDGPAIFAGDRRVLPGRIFKTLVSLPSAYLSGVIGYRSQVTRQSRCSLIIRIVRKRELNFSFFVCSKETPGKMKETVPFSQAQRQYAGEDGCYSYAQYNGVGMKKKILGLHLTSRVAMLVYTTIAKKVGEFDSIIM